MSTITSKPPRLKIATDEKEHALAISLLTQANLPSADIDQHTLLYLFWNDDNPIGTAGLEVFGDCALLRSVSVVPQEQGRGYGIVLSNAIENIAREKGIHCLYLLTTTAKDFFQKQGYQLITREETPQAIKQTAEFSSLCPASAAVMKKMTGS